MEYSLEVPWRTSCCRAVIMVGKDYRIGLPRERSWTKEKISGNITVWIPEHAVLVKQEATCHIILLSLGILRLLSFLSFFKENVSDLGHIKCVSKWIRFWLIIKWFAFKDENWMDAFGRLQISNINYKEASLRGSDTLMSWKIQADRVWLYTFNLL